MKGRGQLGSALLVLAIGIVAVGARADEPSKPRAGVVVTVADGMDNFVEAYLFEVAASVLRNDGYAVAPPHATSAQLEVVGSTAAACAADEACVAELARRVGAPTLLFVDVTPKEGEEIQLVVRGATVRIDGVSLSSPTEAEGSETAMGEPVQTQAERLTDTTPPCHFDVLHGGLSVSIRVDSGEAVSEFPFFVEPGDHAIEVTAAGREAYESRFSCEAGKRYRMAIR